MNTSCSDSERRSRPSGAWLPIILPLALLGITPEIAAQTSGGEVSPIQAAAWPLGLNIIAPVMQSGSDAASASFKQDALPSLTSFLNKQLSESRKINDCAMLLDPSRLRLLTESDVRVYFLGEGAGYNNTLGFNTAEGSVTKGNADLIFPNVSSSDSTYDPASTVKGSTTVPLLPGDFVDLGKVSGDTLLNFFLIAKGASGGKDVFSTDQSVNPDGINHVVAFAYAVPSSSFLIIGFEDLLGGGDPDFNGLLFAVDIGACNIAALTGTPEPAFCLTMGTLVIGTIWLKRRRDLAVSRLGSSIV